MKIKELTVSLNKKVAENYVSKGVSVSVTVDIEEGDDRDKEYLALSSWCAAKISGTLKAHGALPSQTEPALRNTPQPTPKQTTAPQPSGDLTFPVESITVDIKGGKRYAKAKGGNFKMYGVNVWDEVAAMPPLEWNLQEMDGAEFPMEPGVVAIYIEKAITTKDGVEKMVPDKVTGWA